MTGHAAGKKAERRAPISVIIPVLNEAEIIRECLSQFDEVDDVEVLVVDGGSDDPTRTRVAQAVRVRLIQGRIPCRSHQMNTGAAEAVGDILLFLHADCELPAGWTSLIREAMADYRSML